jgi:hypothetical protein
MWRGRVSWGGCFPGAEGGGPAPRLRPLYRGRVSGGADLVTCWFEKARAQIAAGQGRAAGLVATNSIRGGANRTVLGRTHPIETNPILEHRMATVICDTRRLVDRLKAAGFPPERAEAVVRVIGEAQEELVTKTYLDHTLERTLAPLRTDLSVLKWMMGVLLAGVMSLILKGFF